MLRVTACVAFSYECIIHHLDAFRAEFPNIKVEFLTTGANVDIFADKIDLAIRLASAPEGDVISTRLVATYYRV